VRKKWMKSTKMDARVTPRRKKERDIRRTAKEKRAICSGTDPGGIRIWMKGKAQELAVRATHVYFRACYGT